MSHWRRRHYRFRCFQVDLRQPVQMDDPHQIPQLTAYGEELGRKILNDETDRVLDVKAIQMLQHL